MKRRDTRLVVSLFFIYLSLPAPAISAGDIVITEIGAYAAPDHEWIEIYNRGGAAVDMTNWKFWEDATNHGLTAFQEDATIDPSEYAIIADVAANFKNDYPSFSGTILDSSWTTLNESGEEIGLKDGSGGYVEKFTYISAPTHSLERSNTTLDDYTSANWKEHATGDTAGAPNSSAPATPPPPPSSGGGGSAPVTAPPQSGAVRINEFVADPTDNDTEWIELWNGGGASVDLSGWSVEDGVGTKTKLSGTIAAQGFFLIESPKGALNNSGDRIILRDQTAIEADAISYGIWEDGNKNDNAPAAQDPNSVARKIDGGGTGSDNTDWIVTATPTPGAPNVIANPQIPVTTNISQSPIANSQLHIASPVRISEIFPNPRGDDIREFIELENTTDAAVDLKDADIAVGAERYRIGGSGESARIAPRAFFVLPRTLTALILPNDGATVSLRAANFSDELRYPKDAPEEASFARTASSTAWTATPTAGAPNKIVTVNRAPIVSLEMPTEAEAGMFVVFDASDTRDPDGDHLYFRWNFGDRTAIKGFARDLRGISHAFSRIGKFTIELLVSDRVHTVRATRTLTVTPSTRGVDQPRTVRISELAINPKGADNNEWIEFENIGAERVDMTGWTLEDALTEKVSEPFPLLRVPARGFATLPLRTLKLTLKNSEGHVRLFTPEGDEIDEIEYESAPDGFAVARDAGGAVRLTSAATPGRKNFVTGSVTVARAGIKPSTTNVAESIFPVGKLVNIEGVVSVAPGILGTQIAYLADPPVQLYQSKKDFPKLEAGDRVRVRGQVSVVQGGTRIKIKKQGDITVLEKREIPKPVLLASNELNEDALGKLAQIEGDVVEVKKNQWVIDDDQGEIRIAIRAGAGINPDAVRIDDRVRIAGIVSGAKDGARLLPRGNDDIEIVGHVAAEEYAAPSKGGLGRGTGTRRAAELGIAGALGALLVGARARLAQIAVGRLAFFGSLLGASASAKKEDDKHFRPPPPPPVG